MLKASFTERVFSIEEQRATKFLRDNPILDRLIEVGTKALRRGLMSGETLRAPRQQLRRLRASAFDLFPKFPAIARLSGAFSVFGTPGSEPASLIGAVQYLQIRKIVRTIQKNLTRLSLPPKGVAKLVCCFKERSIA